MKNQFRFHLLHQLCNFVNVTNLQSRVCSKLEIDPGDFCFPQIPAVENLDEILVKLKNAVEFFQNLLEIRFEKPKFVKSFGSSKKSENSTKIDEKTPKISLSQKLKILSHIVRAISIKLSFSFLFLFWISWNFVRNFAISDKFQNFYITKFFKIYDNSKKNEKNFDPVLPLKLWEFRKFDDLTKKFCCNFRIDFAQAWVLVIHFIIAAFIFSMDNSIAYGFDSFAIRISNLDFSGFQLL